jgi:hypothetical protein
MAQLDELPQWAEDTVAILCTGAGWPHAIPVSTVVRAGPRRALVALALRRESLARLREDPRCALAIMAGADIACTAYARARIVQEEMSAADGVAAVALDVEAIQDHTQPRFAIDAGVAWHWIDEEACERDRAIRAALAELASALT